MSGGAGCARPGETMTALRLSLTLVAMFVGSLGAALGLYAAAFMGVHDDIDPFLRDIAEAAAQIRSPGNVMPGIAFLERPSAARGGVRLDPSFALGPLTFLVGGAQKARP